jgi:hypothetical protein
MNAQSDVLLFQMWQLGWDSLVGGLLAGFVLHRWRDRVGLAMLFALCDGMGSLLSGMLPHRPIDTPDLLLYAFIVIVTVLARRRGKAWLLAWPFIFGLDNLLTATPPGSVPGLACSSGCLALAGMSCSALISSAARRIGCQARSLIESRKG